MLKIRGALLAMAALSAMAFAAKNADAKVYSLPSSNPVATIDLTDSWKPDTFDGGVEMTSPDGGLYFSAESVTGKELSSTIADTLKTLEGQGLQIDPSSKQENDFENNGVKFHDFTYKATDKDGPTNFELIIIDTDQPGTYVMLTYWGSDAADKANDDAMTKVMQSIQLTK